MMASDQARVFISYVHDNESDAGRLCRDLDSHGVAVWRDRESIGPGSRWKDAIRTAIDKGACFIACFSVEYAQREETYMNEELTLAIERLRRLSASRRWFIPVKLNQCEIPDRDIGAGETLRAIQWVDLYRNWDAGMSRILRAIGFVPQPESALSCFLYGDYAVQLARKSLDWAVAGQLVDEMRGLRGLPEAWIGRYLASYVAGRDIVRLLDCLYQTLPQGATMKKALVLGHQYRSLQNAMARIPKEITKWELDKTRTQFLESLAALDAPAHVRDAFETLLGKIKAKSSNADAQRWVSAMDEIACECLIPWLPSVREMPST